MNSDNNRMVGPLTNITDDAGLEIKHDKLKGILEDMGKVLVAFSGGVDSSLLLAVAKETLGQGVSAATVDCPMYPSAETRYAKELGESLGVRHHMLEMDVLDDEGIASNPPDRCYSCKKAIFGSFITLAGTDGLGVLVDGSNTDDAGDFRPGARAVRELGVRSPLKEAGLCKREIRSLSKAYGLGNWDKPAAACLASRVPYGVRLTREILKRIESSEDFLKGLGFKQVRVRHHGDMARIEVPAEDLPAVAEKALRIYNVFKELGYNYATLDLGGYRTGSMNEGLSQTEKESALGTASK